MSWDAGHPHDGDDASQDPLSDELARYAHATEILPPTSFADRVMTRIEHEPPPRFGVLRWLSGAAEGGPSRLVRVAMVAAVLVVAAIGTLAAGELAGFIRQQPVGTTPSVIATPTVKPPATATPRATPTPSASATPSATPSTTSNPEPSASAHASELETPGPSASEDNGGSSGHGSGEASASAQPSNSSDG